MKRYNSYEELLKDNGIEFKSSVTYATNELYNFMDCIGSNIVDNKSVEPVTTFKIEVDNKRLEIGVTSIMTIGNEEDDEYFTYYYWVEEY